MFTLRDQRTTLGAGEYPLTVFGERLALGVQLDERIVAVASERAGRVRLGLDPGMPHF